MAKREPKHKFFIKDDLLTPFKIGVDKHQYVVYEHTGKDYKFFGYYTRLGIALADIVRQKLYYNQVLDVIDLQTYMQQYNDMLNEFSSKIKV